MLFLDEPSAGLDPQARLEIHDLVQDLRREQRTILLTTHYIEEAEKLCDRVAIVDEGRIIAMGTPREIQERALGQLRPSKSNSPRLSTVCTSRRGAMPSTSRSTTAAAASRSPPRRPPAPSSTWSSGWTQQRLELADIRIQRPIARRRLHRTHRKEPARMKAYLALFQNNLHLTLRDRSVLFFNLIFPFIFFFVFAELFNAGTGAGIAYFVGTVLTMGILGNGLWGAGMRSVQDREPISCAASKSRPSLPSRSWSPAMISGWLLYLPVVVLLLAVATSATPCRCRTTWPPSSSWSRSAVCAFRALGLILAAVTNTMQEATIAIQLLYMPMLFLSGATIPAAMLPNWAQTLAEFMPAAYLVTGFQGIFFRNQTIFDNRLAVGALLVSTVLGMFLAVQLFRWEKGREDPAAQQAVGGRRDGPVSRHGRVARLQPASTSARTRPSTATCSAPGTCLIRNARIFVGDGTVIENGSVLLRDGKIAEVFQGAGPDPDTVKAEVVEGAGKTLLPGLVDVHVHLGAPGGISTPEDSYDATRDHAPCRPPRCSTAESPRPAASATAWTSRWPCGRKSPTAASWARSSSSAAPCSPPRAGTAPSSCAMCRPPSATTSARNSCARPRPRKKPAARFAS